MPQLLNSVACFLAILLLLGAGFSSAEEPQLTVAQQERLAEAKRLNNQVVELYQQGKTQNAIPLAKQALAIRKEVLGDIQQRRERSGAAHPFFWAAYTVTGN